MWSNIFSEFLNLLELVCMQGTHDPDSWECLDNSE